MFTECIMDIFHAIDSRLLSAVRGRHKRGGDPSPRPAAQPISIAERLAGTFEGSPLFTVYKCPNLPLFCVLS